MAPKANPKGITPRGPGKAATFLLACLSFLVLSPALVLAQAQNFNVSNLSGTNDSTVAGATDRSYANAFTTGGSSSDRFRLDRVELEYVLSIGITGVTPRIHNAASDGTPGTKLGDLTKPDTFPSKVAYTATGIVLHGATTYFLVADLPADVSLLAKTGNAETGSAGWSIADALHRRDSTTWSADSQGRSLSLSVSTTNANPPAPVNSNEPTVGNRTITLTWDKYAQETGKGAFTKYRVHHRPLPSGTEVTTDVTGINTTSRTISGLTNGQLYEVHVTVCNAHGCSTNGGVSRRATPVSDVGKPAGLRGHASQGRIVLFWSAISDATGWQYRRKTGSAAWGAWQDIASSGGTTDTHDITGVSPGTYSIQVRAVDADGPGPPSDAVEVVMMIPPVKPANFEATRGDGQVVLSWDAQDVASYWQYQTRSVTASWSGQWTRVPNSGAATSGYTVPNLDNGTAYVFRVRAVNNGGFGPASTELTMTPQVDVPAQATGLVVQAGDRRVTLGWTAIAGVMGWQYQFKTGSGEFGSWTTVPRSGASTNSYAVTGLSNGTAYAFRVRAVNAGGAGAASSEVAATPGAPGRPANVDATGGNGQVTLTWTATGVAATGWQYRQRTGSTTFGAWQDIQNSGAGTTSHTVGSLVNGVEYFFRVRARNAVGNGPGSDRVMATPADPSVTKPGQATGLTATPGNRQVTLRWTAIAAATGWQYQRRTGSGGNWGVWRDVESSGATTVTHTLTGLTNGILQGFRVRARNAGGTGQPSAERTATPNGPLPKPVASAAAGNRQVTLLSVFTQIDGALITYFGGHSAATLACGTVLQGCLEGKAPAQALRTAFQSSCPSGGRMRRARRSSLTRRSAARSPTGSASNATRMRFGVQASAHSGTRLAMPAVDRITVPGRRHSSRHHAESASIALSVSMTVWGSVRSTGSQKLPADLRDPRAMAR